MGVKPGTDSLERLFGAHSENPAEITCAKRLKSRVEKEHSWYSNNN
jgi:hypothetical protein